MNNLITLLVGFGSPILVATGGVITWFIKSKREELKAVEEKALAKRIEIYSQILYPMIVLLTNNATKEEKDKATLSISSIEYKQAAFNLITFGSDEMVESYNDMKQSLFKKEHKKDLKSILKNFGKFILSIRKDIHDKNTKLNEWDMLKFMITDFDKVIKE